MSQYYAIVTDVGNAKISNALALGKTISLTHMAVGDSNGINSLPNPSQKSLINEKFRAQINSLTIDDENQNVVIAEFIIPEDIGGFYVRELGVFDNEGNLIAVGNTPESYKPKMTEGSGAQKVMRMHLVTSASDKIELKINPSIVVATVELVNQKINDLNKVLATKSDKTHNHDGSYALKEHTHTDLVQKDRQINGKNLSTDITLTASDVNAMDKTASNADVNAVLTKLGLKEASLNQNGWMKFPNGLIIQWGISYEVAGNSKRAIVVNFPIAFPNRVLHISEHDITSEASTSKSEWVIRKLVTIGFEAFLLGIHRSNDSSFEILSGMSENQARVQFFAIGY